MEFNVGTKIYGKWASAAGGRRAPLDFHTWYRIFVVQIYIRIKIEMSKHTFYS